MKAKIHSKVTLLANELIRKFKWNRSDAFRAAWEFCKGEPAEVLTWTKVSGEKCRRVVVRNWNQYYTPKGTGKSVQPRQLFADAAKVIVTKNPIISVYPSSIISLAA